MEGQNCVVSFRRFRWPEGIGNRALWRAAILFDNYVQQLYTSLCLLCVLRNLTSLNLAGFRQLLKRIFESVRAGLLVCNYR